MKKIVVFILILAMAFPLLRGPMPVHAAENDVQLLILHNLESKGQEDEVYMLDLLAGHFTETTTILSLEEALEDPFIENYSHVIYLRLNSKEPTVTERSLFKNYSGNLYLMGDWLDSLGVSEDMEIQQYIEIDKVYRKDEVFTLENSKSVMTFNNYANSNVFFQAKANNQMFPLIFEKNDVFYAATQSISGHFADFIGESLFDFFKMKRSEPQKFMRLEDIHPKSDPEILKEVGDYLASMGIPYAITVIPVYTNPETGERITLSESVKLVKVLQEMQRSGASIVLHGYYHQYRDSETGEGSEYWDIEHNRPIYQGKNEPVLKRGDFATEQEYKEFLKKGAEFEERYIADTIQKGIFDLVEEGLYPIAFEAPHYSISQAGYRIVSEYFTTYVGQVQISDETYEATYAPLVTSKPSKLHGLKLIPEGMGYIDANNPHSVDEMMKIAERTSKFSDSQLSFFFHPYIGIDKLKEVMEGMEKYEEYEWFDLSSVSNKVEAEGIAIQVSKGDVKVTRSMDIFIKQEFKNLWWFAIPFLVFVIILLISIIAMKRNKKNMSHLFIKQE